MDRYTKVSLLTLVTSLISLPTASAQITETKLTASDGAASDQFGSSGSLSGNYALVGAWLDDENGPNSGSAYIFRREGAEWIEEAKLRASDGAGGDYFGWSVSLSGDYALVGAYFDDDNGDRSGSAYIVRREGTEWIEEAKLTASDGAADDLFGWSVSLSGDYALVGAFLDDEKGSAYIYRREGAEWIEEAKLTASDGARGDWFGYSVSLSGDYALVGSVLDGPDAGSAYIFRREGTDWIEEAKLRAGDGGAFDEFGWSVSLSGDCALIGASGDDDNGDRSGSAYIFRRKGTEWTEEAKLTASDGAAGDEFGWSVSLSGDFALVGADKDDDIGTDAGSAYFYRREGTDWIEEVTLTARDGAAFDYFGRSVSLSGDYALVGAHGDDDNGGDSGSAYVYFARPPAPLLSLPLNGAALQPLSLALVWEGALGASTYHAQLDADGSFNAPIAEDSTLTDRFMEIGGLATANTYYWRARAKSFAGSGPWSETWSFTTGANPPAAPQQVSPPDMAAGIATTFSFEWSDTTSGATWGLQIATGETFLDPEVDLTGLTATSEEVAGLAGETMHYWRVNAVTAGGTSAWSAPWSFTTRMAPPAPPALLAPPDGFVNPATTLLFRWNGADGASTYHFQLATDDQFSFIAINDSTLTGTTRIASNLTEGEEYFWRVAAENDGGKSDWSAVWSVTVLATGVDQDEGLPTEFSLGQNYPNPFNPSTTINYGLPTEAFVRLEVINTLGERVSLLVEGVQNAGYHSVVFEAEALPSGIYFYRLQAGEFVETKKLLFLK